MPDTSAEQTRHTKMLREIIEKTGDGLLVLDGDRMIRFLNTAAASILNQSRDDLIGQSFMHPVNNGSVTEIDICRSNGKSGTGEIHSVPIDCNGSGGHLISIRDVTERILFDRLKDDFIRTVSHELRTPLTSLREAISVLKDGVLGEINEEQKDFLSLCLRNTDLLRRIVADLLDLSRIETGQVRLQKKEADFCEIVRDTVTSFVTVIESKGLGLTLSIPETPLNVFADRDRVAQVLNNLIGNALKFTASGSIGIGLDAGDDMILCSVRDTGRGIAEPDMPNVFKKFHQFGEIADPENRGTGLGLAISKEIVRLHGGQITVDSRIERGSTFTFSLPRFRPDLLLIDVIQNRIRSSKEPFLLFHLNFMDNPGIEWEPLTETISRKLDASSRNPGSPAVPIRIDDHEIYFLINLSNEISCSRIIRMVKEALIENETDAEPDFRCGIAGFPRDGGTAEDLIQTARHPVRAEKQDRLSKRIFIVDDELGITESLNTILGLFGYRNVEEFHSGEAVFDAIKTRAPDLMILDMHMPGMSGYEVVGRLKERYETKDIPIIIMSGYEVQEGLFSDYISRKAILTLNKPVKADLLRKMIYYLLS
ncbi:MAG TPA: response regulator [bacterium]|nr:response regulator [bacterium]